MENNLPIEFHVGSPNLSNSFLANMIGGRAVLSMPGMDRTCQQQLKKDPLDKLKTRILKAEARKRGRKNLKPEDYVNLIGTRFDESAFRSTSMTKRGESSLEPTLITFGKTKTYVLSPIANFTTMDVFEYIGQVTSGRIHTYSDFVGLTQVYRDSDGECMVNSHFAGKLDRSSNFCNSRTGCFICGASGEKDESMDNMLADEDGRFAWMQTLNDIRNYIVASLWDMSKRSWLPRSVKDDGSIDLKPNTYSPEFCLELLRYYLTADADEMDAMGPAEMRFQCLPEEHLIYIALLWTRYGYYEGAKVLQVYKDIMIEGNRYYPPTIANPVPRASVPNEINVPFADDYYNDMAFGFRDLLGATADVERTIEKSGKLYMDVDTDSELSIDLDGMYEFFDWEAIRVADRFTMAETNSTATLFTFFRYGFVKLNSGGHSRWDEMLKFGNQVRRHGITPADRADPVILKQKLAKSLGLETAFNTIPIFHSWESDPRKNPTYKEKQVEMLF